VSAPLALGAALSYGIGDFAGAVATKREPVLVVTAYAQLAGLVVLVPAVLLLPGSPSVAALVIGALSGLAGTAGLAMYFRGLAIGPMGVVAPLSAVVSAGLPFGIGVLLGGERPGILALVATGLALVAVWLTTSGSTITGSGSSRHGVLLGLGSGVGFGLFFVGLDATPDGSGLWPLLGARTTSVTVLIVILLLLSGPRLPRRPGLMIVSGFGDTFANVLFLLATRAGLLSLSAVLVSLYPVVVALLARWVLGERLTRVQSAAAVLAVAAAGLLAAAS
jgi:drug/metabolite transporter (DMT)-like permease